MYACHTTSGGTVPDPTDDRRHTHCFKCNETGFQNMSQFDKLCEVLETMDPDTFNQLMVIPNVLALIALGSLVVAEAKKK